MLKNYLLCSVSVATVLAGLPACAQAQSAAGASTSSAQLEEVVVTAQRRSENLQDVPVSVATFSGGKLAQAGINNIIDLGTQVPGLSVARSAGYVITHLRGVGSTAIGPGVENPVGIYVDGVYYASTSSSFLDFLNVENVEVLKGPQGTLFGRNATGGLIQVTTKDPTQATHIDAHASFADRLTARGDFYLTTGITDTLAADIAIQGGASGDGWGKNLHNGQEVYKNYGDFSARSKWLWTPTDSTRVILSFDYGQQHNTYGLLSGPVGSGNLPFLANQPLPSSNPWEINSDVKPLFSNKSGGAALHFERKFDFANLTNIVAYRRSRTLIHMDLDGTPEPYSAIFITSPENQFSEEVQLASKPDSSVKWTAGLYYFRSSSQYDPSHVTFDTNPALAFASPPFASLSIFGKQKAESISGYGQATAKILPATNLTLGIRYTHETHNVTGEQFLYLANGVPIADIVYPKSSSTFKSPTYRVALDHHLNDNVLLYVSWSTGFKSGGFNTQSPGDPAYLPEKLTAYEAGIKGDFLDHTLRANLSAFHYQYRNIQVQKLTQGVTGIINGAAATINGVDLDVVSRLTENLTINGSAEYLDAEFDSFPNAPLSNPSILTLTPVTIGSAAGNRLPYASRFSLSLAGNYTLHLQDSSLLFNVAANHASSYFLEPDNVVRQKAYTKLDTFVEWEPDGGRYGVRLWAKNLTNKGTILQDGTLPIGSHLATYAAPRTFGVTFSYHR